MDLRDLHHVLDAVLDGLIVVDGEGRIAHVNAEACRILESSPDQIAGTALRDHFGADHPVSQLEQRVREERRGRVLDDVRIERRFDRALEVDLAISPVELGESSPAAPARARDPYEDEELELPREGVVIELRDHTLRSSLREKEKQREELAGYGHIAIGIAHEVKNPLGGIRGAAELLGTWSESERAKQTASMIVREVDRITALVDELMVFARGDALELAPVNIHQVLDGVIDLAALDPLAAGVTFERIYDPSIPELLGDAARLTQVFVNLVRNAVQALEGRSDGRVTVTTRIALDDRLTNRNGRQVPTVVIEVRDDGPGIAAESLARMTTPFFTTRAGGTGLGVPMARHWVARHDGDLRIASEVGKGTRVRVALPLGGPHRTRPNGGTK